MQSIIYKYRNKQIYGAFDNGKQTYCTSMQTETDSESIQKVLLKDNVINDRKINWQITFAFRWKATAQQEEMVEYMKGIKYCR